MLRAVLAGLFGVAQPGPAVAPPPPDPVTLPAGDRVALAAAARDLCGRRVALLGEAGTHGDGRTAAFKVALARHLIERCGYGAIIFESSRYEFIAAERALRERTASRATIADAVGALWKYDREFAPLLDLLFARARAGRLRLAGMDSQIGGLGEPYANEAMVPELVRPMPAVEAQRCTVAFARHVAWEYPADRPYGAAEHDRLLACVAAMRQALDTDRAVDTVLRAERAAMIDNLGWAIGSDQLPRAGKVAAREQWLFRNFEAVAATLPRNAKIIVWGASVHLARTTDADRGRSVGSMVHDRYGPRAFSIGFSALGGRYRVFRRVLPVPPPPVDAVERTRPMPADGGARYLDRAALRQVGTRPGGAIDRSYRPTDWAEALDGMVIFAEEWPTHSTRPGYG